MAAKSKPFSLSAMVDTDGEGNGSDEGAASVEDTNKENASTGVKKKGGRPKANAKRFTKPKRLTNESIESTIDDGKKSKVGRKKAPLAQVDQNRIANADEIDEFAQSDTAIVAKDSNKLKAGTKRKATEDHKGRATKARDTKQVGLQKVDGEFQYTPTHNAHSGRGQVASAAISRKLAGATRHAAKEVPETQADDNADTSLPVEDDLEEEETLEPVVTKRSNIGRAPLNLKHPLPARGREGSPSEAEQGMGDPALRRKLGDMTRKYDSISVKYRDLRDVGIKEAETNYENMRQQAENNRKAAGDLIASLKKEIATQKAIAQETHSLRSQLCSREADLTKAKSLANETSKSLVDVQNENKVLQAKLASSRGASVPAERTPGSAIRSKAQLQPKTGSTSGTDLATAQLKDDLYSDLTGLILRGVDVGPEADTFDCIQTGRNGTLHFKLAVTKDPEESYEDVEFQYTPRLDSSRDHDLIELLPEYLTEEITFSRMNAAPFYARIMETLMKKRAIEPVG